MNKCRTSLDLFFAIWFVMGNLWAFDSRLASFQRAPKLHLLCSFLLIWNAICYSFPFILFLLLCCCVPLISSFIGYNINMGSTEKGALDDQISQLPCWKYKAVDANINPGSQPHNSNTGLPKEDPVSNISFPGVRKNYWRKLEKDALWRAIRNLNTFICLWFFRNVAFALPSI